MPDKHGVETIGELWRDPRASLLEKVYGVPILAIVKGSNAIKETTDIDLVDEIGGRIEAGKERDAAHPGRRVAKRLLWGVAKRAAGDYTSTHRHR
jgi:hypothetical protein